MKKKILLIFTPLIISLITTLFINSNIENLNQPPYMPPGLIFGIVWTILYILMGFSLLFVYKNKKCVKTFITQFILNILWPIIFFNLKLYSLSLIWMILLIILVNKMLLTFKEESNIAVHLNIPYFVWLLIAYYLNVGIYLLN